MCASMSSGGPILMLARRALGKDLCTYLHLHMCTFFALIFFLHGYVFLVALLS